VMTIYVCMYVCMYVYGAESKADVGIWDEGYTHAYMHTRTESGRILGVPGCCAEQRRL
jgi:hypothetical protein